MRYAPPSTPREERDCVGELVALTQAMESHWGSAEVQAAALHAMQAQLRELRALMAAERAEHAAERAAPSAVRSVGASPPSSGALACSLARSPTSPLRGLSLAWRSLSALPLSTWSVSAPARPPPGSFACALPRCTCGGSSTLARARAAAATSGGAPRGTSQGARAVAASVVAAPAIWPARPCGGSGARVGSGAIAVCCGAPRAARPPAQCRVISDPDCHLGSGRPISTKKITGLGFMVGFHSLLQSS